MMRSAVITGTAHIEMREMELPKLGPGDILLRVHSCGVCGTDVMKVVHGVHGSPLVLGHEVAGEVADIGVQVTKFRVGDRVVVAHHTPCYVCHYCRHQSYSMCAKFKSSNLDPGGFSEYVRIPSEHAVMTAFHIPYGMSFDKAIFMEPIACVLRNLKRTRILSGDTVLIVGLGSMGLLTGQIVRNSGARVIATDLHHDRLEIGRNLGFERVHEASDPLLGDTVEEMTESRGVDLVVLTAGGPSVYSRSVAWVRDGGSINIFGGLGPHDKVAFSVNELYKREITVFSSYSASPTELAEALELLRVDAVRVDVLAARCFGLDQVGEAIESVRAQKLLKAVIRPEAGHA